MQTASNRFYIVRAWMVHIYTSLGLITALFTLAAIVTNQPQLAFWLQGASLWIDATDGTLARRWQVKKYAATFDGRKLDDITDYINYTFLPIFFVYQFNLIPSAWVWVLGIALVTGSYGFCQCVAKTDDGFFTGFPNYWNLLVFYLFIFKLDPVFNAVILLVFSFLIFVPIKYLSYSSRPFRKLTILISGVYGIVLAIMVNTLDQPILPLVWASLLAPAYTVLMSLYLQLRESKTAS